MSKYFDPRDMEVTVLGLIRYDMIKDPDGVVYKDMGRYVQMLVPMNNDKGHDTYEVYYGSNGKIEKVYGHPGNSGFVGYKYF